MAAIAAALAATFGCLALPGPPKLAAQAQSPKTGSAPIATKNTGQRPGDGFLIDLLKGYDEATQYLSDYDMDADWIRVAFRPDNIRFNQDGMTISLLRTSGGKLPFSGSEFQRRGYYGYGRYEGVLRASPGYGAVSSFFTYTGPPFGDPHDEIDFEFLGRSPREVHTNYFRNGADDAVDIPLWFDATQDYHLYVIYWTPDSIRWIIDGHIVRVVTAQDSKIGIPSTSGKLMANIWTGNGGTTQWTGVANFSRASTTYRCIAHVPLGKSGPKCGDTFKAPPVR